mgnify:CR=1 FL=1
MSIRAKIVIVAFSGMALYMLFALLFGWLVVGPAFSRLEGQLARRDLLRCMQALDREVQHLNQFCSDWAAWDDTYAYVKTPTPEYEASNLVEATLADNELSLLYVLRPSGEVVWGKEYDYEANVEMEFPEFPDDHWGRTHPLLSIDSPAGSIAGPILTSRGPMLVSSRPIVTSNNAGPIRGVFVMGRLLTDNMMKQLREQTQIEMFFRPLPGSDAAGISASAAGRQMRTHVMDGRTLQIHTVVLNAFGDPVFLLRALLPREIARTGARIASLAAWAVIGGGLVCLWAMLYLMRRLVTTPLAEITRHVTRIGETGELQLADTRGRKDELGTLSRQFNKMLVRLEHDAAARERAQAALRESEERFQRLLQSIEDIVWSSSPDGEEVFFANPATEKVLGRPPEDFLKIPGLLCSMMHPEDRLDAQAILLPVQENGHAETEYRVVRPDGAIRWVHDRRVLVRDEEGAPVRVAGIISDITELKQMHERMSETQRLAELGEMGASIAHELRNPLAGIAGALQVIRDGFPEQDPRRDAIGQSLAQVARMEQTVQHVLRYAKPWTPHRQYADLRAFARDVFGDLLARQGTAGVACEVRDGAPVRVPFDPNLLEEACANAVQNAVSMMPDGGTISVEIARRGPWAEMGIYDTGPGFAPEALERALDPFFTTKARGTGLGLVICRRILEAHGGRVRLENRPAGGAAVTFILPGKEG